MNINSTKAQDDLFQRGIDLFNQEMYFECHEVFEDLWRQQAGQEKQFTQALIQFAVALHHFKRDNQPGALKLCERALARLQPLPPRCLGIDVSSVIAQVERLKSSADGQFHPRLDRQY